MTQSKSIQLRDAAFPGSRLDLFLVFCAGLYLLKQVGLETPAIWLPAAAGCVGLFATWLVGVVARGKAAPRLFFGLWWLGIVLLALAKVIQIYKITKGEG